MESDLTREHGYYWVRTKYYQFDSWHIGEWEIMSFDGRAWWGTGNEVEYGESELYEIGERITRNEK